MSAGEGPLYENGEVPRRDLLDDCRCRDGYRVFPDMTLGGRVRPETYAIASRKSFAESLQFISNVEKSGTLHSS